MTGQGKDDPYRHWSRAIEPDSFIDFLMDGGDGTVRPHEVSKTVTPQRTGTRLVQAMVLPTLAHTPPQPT